MDFDLPQPGRILSGHQQRFIAESHRADRSFPHTLEMVEGYPSRIPVIRWRIPACANGYPPAGADSGADGPFSANRWRVSGYPKGYPRPGGEMAGWKEALPAGEVLVPRRLEGHPSSRRGTCTSSTGRTPFQSARYMYLVDWKDTLPVGEVQVPRRLEGNPSSRRGTSTSPAGRKPFQPVRRRPSRGRVSEDTRSDTRCGRRIPASGCGCGCGCAISLKLPSDIRIRTGIRMRTDHLHHTFISRSHQAKEGCMGM
ncbi:hypothetical protein PGT21_006501 [Puccinia graminis f. sp. tritici]|uniref:Uncharacterized protein n=1 Tax=Puccinia graminis f. sp. tritici TaxID=56615 RepID=A0A5B0PVS1_PUCGR|nr:hypothetical protein PGT21_006501 [Puccinia graminis f. sp. tritici]KAA1104914.1 hypothetical protein PGTUg99_010586 [Puccinia graminis f. sp. tritici]